MPKTEIQQREQCAYSSKIGRAKDMTPTLVLNVTIHQVAMANSEHWYGHVMRREDGHVLRREDGHALRREDGHALRREDGHVLRTEWQCLENGIRV